MRMQRFQIVPPLREYETSDSFVSRLAALNQMASVVDMCRLLGESSERANVGPRFRRFAKMAGVDPTRFEKHTLKFTRFHALIGDHRIKTAEVFKSQSRFCPKCVIEDVNAGNGPIGARTFQRMWWLWAEIERCPDHGCKMALAEGEPRSFAPDLCSYVTRHHEKIATMASKADTVAAHPMDIYLRERMIDRSMPTDMLDELPVAYVVRLCEAVGRAALSNTDRNRHSVSELKKKGFELLSLGRVALFEHLERQARNFDGARGLTRLSKYGRLYVLMRKEAADPVWAPIREALWVDASKTLPLAAGEDFLGYSLERRLLHSLYSAAKQYGMHPNTILKMIGTDEAVATKVHRSSYHSTVIPAEEIEDLLEQLQSSYSPPEVCETLGMNIRTVTMFRGEGYLRTVEAGLAFGQQRPRYVAEDVNAIKRNLEACRVGRIRGAYRPFLDVFRWARMKTPEAYRLMLEGKIASVRKPGDARFDTLYIDYWDVMRLMGHDDVAGIPLSEAGKLLGTTDLTILSLIEHGYLVPHEQVPRFGRTARAYLDHDDVVRFGEQYGSMSAIANELGIAIRAVSSVIRSEKIEPLYPAIRFKGKTKDARMFDKSKVFAALGAAGLLKHRHREK